MKQKLIFAAEVAAVIIVIGLIQKNVYKLPAPIGPLLPGYN